MANSSLRRGVALLGIGLLLAAGLGAAPTQSQDRTGLPDVVELPAELDVVLRAYEMAWRARDADALAELFTEDGYVMSSGRPPAVGQAAIRERYANSGGPLALVAYSFAVEGDVGYVIGGYGGQVGARESGKFVLALRRTDAGWLIAADMDNGNG